MNGETPVRSYLLSILKWPEGRPIPEPGGWVLYRADFDRLGVSEWQPARVEPEGPSP